jgi:hypothetical protein
MTGARQLLDPGLDGGDVGAGLVDACQHGAHQEPVVLGEVFGERLSSNWGLDTHPGLGQLGQRLGVGLAGDRPGTAKLWIGPKGTVTPLHFDEHSILFAQVHGRKHSKLIPAR